LISLTRQQLIKFVLPGIIVVMVFLILGIIQLLTPKSEPKAKQERAWLVEAVTVQYGDYQPDVTTFGRVESPQKTDIHGAVSADVMKVPVREGDSVKKGQLLIELDNRQTKFELERRESQIKALKSEISEENSRYEFDQKALEDEKRLLKLASSEVERQKSLYAKKHASQRSFDQSSENYHQRLLDIKKRNNDLNNHKHRLSNLEAKLAEATALAGSTKVDLEHTVITAPFSGKITKLNVAVGDRIRPGDSIIELFNTNDIEVRAPIPTKYIATVKKAFNDGKVLTATSVIDEEKIDLQLKRLGTEVETGQTGIDGLFQTTKGQQHLAIGRQLVLTLNLPKKNHVIELPIQAIHGLKKVYKIVDDRLVGVDIIREGFTTSKDGKQRMLISSKQLKDGDKVLITPLPNAITGLKVEIGNKKK